MPLMGMGTRPLRERRAAIFFGLLVATLGGTASVTGATAAKEGSERAPVSLTSSDGTGLRIVSLRARAVVSGPLAFTELHLAFRNAQPRVIEGQFAITLPPGAAV